ncbi:hypothetical protein K432DRAFT_423770 [Lepidopterella palustris CBS 459.81]|uniref:SRR1-like domain-containing protein n=1 Tax=Lepidopterella palustris CBS 459.81 TaxID=1314670 RepID=A0A8E2JHR5_9PEZI|nr:hypothetical protein K432DRAFT_423770 [Lepidopterella palustris CBS 459.81]
MINIATIETITGNQPVYSRALIEHVDTVWSTGKGKLVVNDIYGKPHEYDVDPPPLPRSPEDDDDDDYTPLVPGICYASYQQLADNERFDHDSECGDDANFPKVPMIICMNSYPKHKNIIPEVAAAEYAKQRSSWFNSTECAELKQQFQSLERQNFVPVCKIVCFGLGSLSRDIRCHGQHAAVETLSSILSDSQTEGARLPCFAQDPCYTIADKAILADHGIIVLPDPKAFLELDAHTLVVSICPDIPVRQIIADVQWPAALICNTIEEDDTHLKEYTKHYLHGKESWVSPYTTDPSSRRVQAMVEDCEDMPFPACDSFGGTTIYLRRVKPEA